MKSQASVEAKTLVCIPTYNESKNAVPMVEKLLRVDPRFEVLIVDDSSPDGTADLVEKFKQSLELEERGRVHLLKRNPPRNFGKSYIDGFRWAIAANRYARVVQMDCDFSHNPEDVPRLVETLEKGADVVIGSRYIGGIRIMNWPFSRLLLSYGASIYIRLITGMNILDATGGFKCHSIEALKSMDWNRVTSNGYSFQIEVNFKYWKKGLKVVEAPIVFFEREEGESKMRGKIVWEAMYKVLWLKISSVLGWL